MKIIPLNEIDDDARKIAVLWGDRYFPGFGLTEKHKLASDIMNYGKNLIKNLNNNGENKPK